MDAIVDAALAILEAEGVDALSMQRLASDLGYAVGAFYRYFPSKDALWAAMQVRALAALEREVDAALAVSDRAAPLRGASAEGTRALDGVLRVARTFVTLEARRPAHAALIRTSLADPRQLVEAREAAPVALALASLLGRVSGRVEAATRAGVLRPGDAQLRTIALWASLAGATSLRKLERFAPPGLGVEPLVRELLLTLLGGWGAPHDLITRLYQRLVRDAAPRAAEGAP